MPPRNLFIRLLRDGRTVARAAVKGRFVCAGHDWKCQLTDPGSPFQRQKILVRTLSGYRLDLPKEAEATFTYKGSTLDIDGMVAWGLARTTRKGYRLHHRKGMSGAIRMGNSTYILEYWQPDAPGTALLAAGSGHLPFRYRLLIPNRTDLTFVAILTLILLVHIAGVRSLRNYPIPEVTAIRELPRRISRLILEPVAPPPPAVARKGEAGVRGEGPAAGEEKAEPERKEAPPEPEAPPRAEAPAPAAREAIRSQVSKMGVLGVLSGRGTAGRATAGPGISILQLDAELQQDLDSVLGEISGITTTASAAGTGTGVGFGGTEPGSGLIGIEDQLSDANVSALVQVSGLGTSVGRSPGSLDGTGSAGILKGAQEYVAPEEREERSTRTIARVVAAHTGAIRYAYNRELRKKPSLRGKIVLTFTISPDGEVTECRVEESAMNWPPLE
ncbi:MAG: AgmX/PglI C-terminal domain-containing protein, partial [bacterium]